MADGRPGLSAGEALLRVCANPEGDVRDALGMLREQDWDALLAAIPGRRLAPLIQHVVGQSGLTVPDSVRDALADETRWHAIHGLRQATALSHLQDNLARFGHAPVFLKGTGLAYGPYPEPVLRPMRDIDVLLPGDAAQDAQEALLADPRYRIHPELRGTLRSSPEHFPPLQDVVAGATIELHHRIGDPATFPSGEKLAGLLTTDPQRVVVGGATLSVPRAEANLLHLVASAVRKDRWSGGPLILADLHYIASAGLDWSWLWQVAEELTLQRPLAMLAAVARAYGAAWPSSIPAEALAPAEPFVPAAVEALLGSSDDADRGKIVERVTRAGGGNHVIWGAVRLALAPEPIQLGRIVGVDPASGWRWLGYPVWLIRRTLQYGAARHSARRAASPASVRLRQWIEDEEAR